MLVSFHSFLFPYIGQTEILHRKSFCYSIFPRFLNVFALWKKITENFTYVNYIEAFIRSIYNILLSNGLFSLLGQHLMTEEKLHVSNYSWQTSSLPNVGNDNKAYQMSEIISKNRHLTRVSHNVYMMFICVNSKTEYLSILNNNGILLCM